MKELLLKYLYESKTDSIALSLIDFKTQKSEMIEVISEDEIARTSAAAKIYDLASLTKPLTLGYCYFKYKDIFDETLLSLLEHRAGLPAWGLLSSNRWREQIISYPIGAGDELYSDFSALRLMLELEQRLKIPMPEMVRDLWEDKIYFWKDIKDVSRCLIYGYKGNLPNIGVVHDPNALVINEFCSHAGAFAGIEGLSQTFLQFNQRYDFISQVKASIAKLPSKRFHLGFDTVTDPENSTAGRGCTRFTLGHLGFTGTSIWIDAEKMKGFILLNNATKYYWYDKEKLIKLRKEIGQKVWV